MDVGEVLLLVGRYGFATAHASIAEREAAWNKVVAALKQLENDAYSRGCGAGNGDED